MRVESRLVEEMKLIPLSQGQFAQVSDHRYEYLSQWKWAARWSPSTSSYYAQRTEYVGHCRAGKVTIQMHRLLLGLKPRDGKIVDHDNGDTLDNQDHNIRVATIEQNAKNRRRNKNNACGLKGTHWSEQKKRWIAQIQVDGKKIHLGGFKNKELAHAAYCEAAVKYHGDFAKVA
jgi:hypothetical protein